VIPLESKEIVAADAKEKRTGARRKKRG